MVPFIYTDCCRFFETFSLRFDFTLEPAVPKNVKPVPSPLEEVLLPCLEALFECSLGVVDPGVTAQLPWFEAEPRLACMGVCVVAHRLLCWAQADVACGSFRERT